MDRQSVGLTCNEDFDRRNYNSNFINNSIRSYPTFIIFLFDTVTLVGQIWSSEEYLSILTRFMKGQSVRLTYNENLNLLNSSSKFFISTTRSYPTVIILLFVSVSQLDLFQSSCEYHFMLTRFPKGQFVRLTCNEDSDCRNYSFNFVLSSIRVYLMVGIFYLICLVGWIRFGRWRNILPS